MHQRLTQGNILTTGSENTASSGTVDGIEVLADAVDIGDLAVGGLADGIVQARQSAGGNISESLAEGEGGHGQRENGGVLHLERRVLVEQKTIV